MAYPEKYHIAPQQADALLGPLARSLAELEARSQHYLERLRLSPGDEQRLEAARTALTTARTRLDDLWRQSESRTEQHS